MNAKIKEDAKRVFDEIESQHNYTPYVFTFGNGGSCSIANHMETDWTKNSKGAWVVESLCSNSSMITMIANDYGYEQVCSKQLPWKGIAGAALVLISSSGRSKSVINAAVVARTLGMLVIGFTGFNGGDLKGLSDVSVHIDTGDYGTAEDYHSNVMHEVARMLRANK